MNAVPGTHYLENGDTDNGSMDDVAEARRELGRLLAGLQTAAGLSQRKLAPLTGYSDSAVAKAETGRRSAGAEFWSSADAALQADGDLVRGYERVRKLQQATHSARRAQAEVTAGGESSLSAAPADSPATSGASVPDLISCPYCRRTLSVTVQIGAAAPTPEL